MLLTLLFCLRPAWHNQFTPKVSTSIMAEQRASLTSTTGTQWEGMWSRGLDPGQAFDAAKAETALLALIPGSGVSGLAMAPLDLNGKRAFVPGCGRGYSIAALRNGGCANVIGLELAPTAAEAARAYLSSVEASGVSVEDGDFFAFTASPGFDIVYDCTFLCAIPVSLRQAWAEKMAQIVVPGGELVSLIFPFREGAPDPADGGDAVGPGPPFAMSPKLVEQLLLPVGFSLVALERVPPELVTRPFAGEWIARWSRSKTD